MTKKSGTVKVTDDDDNEPYRVSQTSLSGARQGDNGRRRLMPPLHPKLQPYRRVDSPGSSAAPTPSRSRFAQQKQNRKVIPPVNSNKRTRTGLSPALRALTHYFLQIFEEIRRCPQNCLWMVALKSLVMKRKIKI